MTRQEAIEKLNEIWHERCEIQFQCVVKGCEDAYHYEQGYMEGITKATEIVRGIDE